MMALFSFSFWLLLLSSFLASGILFYGQHQQGGQQAPAARWVVDRGSTLRVSGRSNVNSFTCAIDGYRNNDTLSLIGSGTGSSVKLKGSLQIDVQQFDCRHKLITNDLRKTLKSNEYPRLFVRFLSLERAPDISKGNQTIKGWVEVELAGVKKVMQIPFLFAPANAFTLMHGEKIFYFSDFRLALPSKMGGMVKIKDEFYVDFRLKLRPV